MSQAEERMMCFHRAKQQLRLCSSLLPAACAAMLEKQQMVMQTDANHRRMCHPGCNGKDCGWVVELRKLSKGPDERLAEGLKRLVKSGTWNQWQWDAKHPVFHDFQSFRY